MTIQEGKRLKIYKFKDFKISVNNQLTDSIDVELNDNNTISINGKIYELKSRNSFLIESNGNILVFHSRKQILGQLWKRKRGIILLFVVLVVLTLLWKLL